MENIILKNERVYKPEEVKLANKELYNYKIRYIIFIPLIFFVIGGLFIGLSFGFNNDLTILLSGIFIVFVALSTVIYFVFLNIKIKKYEYKNVEYKYTFNENEVIVSTNSETLNQHMVLNYNKIIKVVKCDNYTFLFINKSQALFFLNSDLNNEVYELLKRKIVNYKGI